MNCENCKNKKATLFFADDDGRRHALCAVCGANSSKAVNLISHEHTQDKPAQFLPEPSLYSLLNSDGGQIVLSATAPDRAACKICGSTVEDIQSSGELGCPDCYISFGKLIFPTVPTAESSLGARMPSARRARLNRERILIEARAELRRAIECENFELAATLRDKIRSLEKQ